MRKAKVTIQVMSSAILPSGHYMLIGDAVIKQWRIPVEQNLVLRFGALKQPVRVTLVPHYDGIRISPDMARQMGIHSGAKLRINYIPGSGTLSLGPVIGVLVSRAVSHSADRPFGEITAYCRELVDACRIKGAFVFFFTPKDIHAGSHSTIAGWVYDGGWRKTVLPAPDVVHNRLTSRKLENLTNVQQFMRDIKSKCKASVFNEKYLNKTEVFKALKQDQAMHRYLPESHLLTGFPLLKSMCHKYQSVFLKPIRGSLGKGIIRISRQSDNSFLCQFANVNGARSQQYASVQSLFGAISGKLKANRFQIQQGLQLIHIGGRPIDFRALVQRNELGKWKLTTIVARIAGNHHFVSNLARGGSLSTVKNALAKCNLPAGVRQHVSAHLQKASLELAKAIDAQIEDHFGELGIDLAVDNGGKVWLLEINSKPSKNDNTPLRDSKIRPSVKQMLNYSRFLAGF